MCCTIGTINWYRCGVQLIPSTGTSVVYNWYHQPVQVWCTIDTINWYRCGIQWTSSTSIDVVCNWHHQLLCGVQLKPSSGTGVVYNGHHQLVHVWCTIDTINWYRCGVQLSPSTGTGVVYNWTPSSGISVTHNQHQLAQVHAFTWLTYFLFCCLFRRVWVTAITFNEWNLHQPLVLKYNY